MDTLDTDLVNAARFASRAAGLADAAAAGVDELARSGGLEPAQAAVLRIQLAAVYARLAAIYAPLAAGGS